MHRDSLCSNGPQQLWSSCAQTGADCKRQRHLCDDMGGARYKKEIRKEEVLSLLQSLFLGYFFLDVTLPHKSLLVISAILCQQILCDGLKQIFNVFKKITDLIFEIVQTHDNGDFCLGFILPKSRKTQNWFSLRPHSPAMKGGWVD